MRVRLGVGFVDEQMASWHIMAKIVCLDIVSYEIHCISHVRGAFDFTCCSIR